MRILVALLITLSISTSLMGRPTEGPVRILFLGHDAKHHPSNDYYPMLAEGLGPDGIYFDYHTDVEEAFGDYDYLSQFDGVLLYANHDTIERRLYNNLVKFIEEGGGFIPVHCASFCFRNQLGFINLVGGQFQHHKTGTFTAKIVDGKHPAMKDVQEFETWDETYVHTGHGEDRTILMVREPAGDEDNIKEPEPWTWIRTQGKGRVFYTASGHDDRVWKQDAFHQLIKSGILWAIGDERQASYQKFVGARKPMAYEKRDNIPNYERRDEPLPYQLPLKPEDSLAYTQVPVGWNLKLFASEPDIVNPMQLSWDERGRLWVIETTDYPNEVRAERKGDDKIKILEDTDGDGRCDKITVFADGLNIPTSLTFHDGGVIVHQAPVTLYLKDTDGDDRADVKETLIDGWGPGDTHAGPSNLRYGIDNKIWGTVGYSAFNGQIGGEEKRFGMGVYHFTQDGESMDFLHQFNNNTWGLGFNDTGDVFGSTANNNPSFYGGIPATVLPEGKGLSAKMIASTPKFHPITSRIRQVDAFGAYTAAAGHSFANSDAFPESWRGKRAFVAGPTGNLLGQYQAERDGAGFTSKNAFALVASVDEWFSPVAAEVGPDGNLWIADWYNFIIQHNPTPSSGRGGYDAKNGPGNAHVNPNRDREHGRIYRLVWDKAPESKIVSLAGASTDQLVSALHDSNQFWRLTAQRLIVEGNSEDAVAALKTGTTQEGIGASHALWALHGMGKLDAETHRAALLSADPVLRRNAVRALSKSEAGVALLFESAVINDPDLTTRLAAFVALAEFRTSDPIKNAVKNLLGNAENLNDEWLSAALKASAKHHGVDGFDATSFEPGADLLTKAEWTPRTYSGGDNGGTYTKPDSEGIEGSDCLKIVVTKPMDTSFHTVIGVKANTRYRLSGKIKTKDVKGNAMGALLNVHEIQGGDNRALTKSLKGNQDWTEVSVDFNSEGRREISINALFGGWGQSTGTAWYDDIKLQELVPVVSQETAAKLEPGNAERGKTLFFTHQVAACNRCHQVGGEGGNIGPALDGIAARKGEDYLRKSLVEPNADIAENYPAPVSPMPPMNLLLGEQEIEDVLAYIATLK